MGYLFETSLFAVGGLIRVDEFDQALIDVRASMQ